jgi:hypothetical protein
VVTVSDTAILEWEADTVSPRNFLAKGDDPALKNTGWEN